MYVATDLVCVVYRVNCGNVSKMLKLYVMLCTAIEVFVTEVVYHISHPEIGNQLCTPQ